MFFLVFHGKERFGQVHAHDDHHHVAGDDDHDHHHGLAPGEKPHESPWVVTLPLVLLAIPSVIIGYIALEPMIAGEYFKGVITIDAAKHPALATGIAVYAEQLRRNRNCGAVIKTTNFSRGSEYLEQL